MEMMSVVRHPVEDPAAWLGEDLTRSDSWRYTLPPDALREIRDAIAAARGCGRALSEIRREDFPLPGLSGFLAERRADLETGRGFFVLRGLPVAGMSPEDATLMFWGIGRHLGEPEGQDRAGNLLHDVRDTGQSVGGTDNVRSYQTNEELRFHNDGAAAFLLLCLRGARSGGVSRLVSAVAVFNEIVRTRPDLAELLQQPFHFDARAQHPDGLKIQSVPIFAFHQGRMAVLYKRNYIELAQRFPEVPRLTPAQTEAMDLMDALCRDPRFCLEFVLEPGDLEAGSNFELLHARTHFVDHDDPALRRHLKRLWITLPGGREVPPPWRNTREFRATWQRQRNSLVPA